MGYIPLPANVVSAVQEGRREHPVMRAVDVAR